MKSTARNFFVVVQFILHLESLHHVLNSFECFSSFSACFRLRINSCTFHFNMTNILSVQIMVLFCKGLYVNRYNIFNIFYCRNDFSNLNSKYMFLKCSRSGGTVFEKFAFYCTVFYLPTFKREQKLRTFSLHKIV